MQGLGESKNVMLFNTFDLPSLLRSTALMYVCAGALAFTTIKMSDYHVPNTPNRYLSNSGPDSYVVETIIPLTPSLDSTRAVAGIDEVFSQHKLANVQTAIRCQQSFCKVILTGNDKLDHAEVDRINQTIAHLNTVFAQ